MQIVVSGGFFQVLDYLNRVETLDRLVVIDSIDMTTGAASTGSSSGSSGTTPTTAASSSGAPLLTVTLNARMFTQAQPPVSSTGPGGTSTPTTVPSTTPTTAVG